jgi:hypothetical protein
MKFTVAATAAALALLPFATAVPQVTFLLGFPKCGQQCWTASNTNTGCNPYDFACQCSKGDLIVPAISPCLVSSCTPFDKHKTVEMAKVLCMSNGHPIDIPEPM